MNILHLSDIHFGRERYGIQESFTKRKEILDRLIQTVGALDEGMKPDIVLVTGDIAWRGKASEFETAAEWFRCLRYTLKLEPEQIIFCPGNHDLNRDTAVRFREEELQKELDDGKKMLDIEKCDEQFKCKNIHKLETRFRNYNMFCRELGMFPYFYIDEDGETQYSYLIGTSQFSCAGETFQIFCFNTAHLPYGKVLRDDQMFLGLPQIQSMIDNQYLRDGKDNIYRIALFHHADRYLHPNEQCEYDGRTASLPLLLKHVDLALCGHTETGGMPLLRTFDSGGSLLSGGAAYYNDDHPNSFSILRVHKNQRPEICSFYYNGSAWRRFSAYEETNWSKKDIKIQWHSLKVIVQNWKFAIVIDDKKYDLYSGDFEVNVVARENNKDIYTFDNKADPARLLSISWNIFGAKEFDPNVRIANAPGVFQTIASRAALASYHDFIRQNIKDAKEAYLALYDEACNIQWKLPLDVAVYTEKYASWQSKILWYQMVHELEERFEVTFLHPDTDVPSAEEMNAINWLVEIKDYHSLCLTFQEEMPGEYYAHNENEMGVASQAYIKEVPLAFQFTRKLKFCLFGVEIDFGICDIYLVGGKPKDFYTITRKLRSWYPGDQRKVELVFPPGAKLWLIPKKLPVSDNQNSISVKEKEKPTEGAFTLVLPPQAEVPWPDDVKPFIKEY